MKIAEKMFNSSAWLLVGLIGVTSACAAGRDGDDADGRGDASLKNSTNTFAGGNVEELVKRASDHAAKGDVQAQFLLGLFHDLGVVVRIDHDRAKALVEQAALAKYGVAAAYVAWRYETGFGMAKPDQAQANKWHTETPTDLTLPPDLILWVSLEKGKIRPNFRRALEWMQHGAEQGGVIAQANLANVYVASEWTKQDIEQHVKWLRRAAASGDAGCLERLSQYQQIGVFVEQDVKAAWENICLAADKGSASAQVSVGDIFVEGTAGKADAVEAARYYRMAVAQKYPPAYVKLIQLLRFGGPGMEKNPAEAARVAAEGMELNDTKSIEEMADIHNFGVGVPVDYTQAAELYRRAAAGGRGYAMFQLGLLFEKGRLKSGTDYGQAMHWYRQAAEKEHVPAYNSIGWLYENGLGVEKNLALAFEWTEKAAREGNAWGQNHLGWMLLGGLGIERDEEEAVTWFQLASKNGSALGEANLGYMHLHGRFFPKDIERAFDHLSKALLMDEDDYGWIQSTFTEIWKGRTVDERAKLKVLLKSLMENPKLLATSGHQAVKVLEVAMFNYHKGDEFDGDLRAFMTRLGDSGNLQAMKMLSWCAFTGLYMSYDLEKARLWASAVPDEADRECLLAVYDSVAADAPETQTEARRKLRRLAEGGHRRAAEIMAVRSGLGEGTRYDPEAMVRFYNISKGFTEASEMITSVPEIYKRLHIKPVPYEPAPDPASVTPKEMPGVESMQPVRLRASQPTYPFELKLAGMSGAVLVEFIVDCGGYVRNPVIVKSDHPLFSVAAKAAILRWRFKPGVKNGRTVSARMQQPFDFAITEDEDPNDEDETFRRESNSDNHNK